VEGLTPDSTLAVVLARMDERLAGLVTELEKSNKRMEQANADHEGRIRGLEKWMWALPVSAFASIVTAVAVVVKVVS